MKNTVQEKWYFILLHNYKIIYDFNDDDKEDIISSAWNSGNHSIQSLILLLILLYFPNILLKPLKTNV